MRRLLLTIALLAGFLNLGFGPPAILDASEGSLPLYPSQLPAIKQMRPPEVGAEAYAVIDGETGEMVAGKQAHEHLPPASTTKIATAIVAIERGDLDATVRILPEDVDAKKLPDSSMMGLVAGEELSLRDLLYGLMLPSGNDAALAIARQVGGSEARFMDMVNAKFRDLGLQDSHYVNPHGLDDPDHYTSPYDLAMLARYAMANPEFATIVGTRQYVVQGRLHRYELTNLNPLLPSYNGADGVKTGYTENALQTFVGSVTRDGHRVIVAVMRSHDRLADTLPLLDYYFANLACRTLDLPSNALNRIGGDGRGRDVRVRPAPVVCRPAWQLPFIRSSVWLDDAADAVSDPGARLGFAGFYLGQSLLAEAGIYER